MLCGRVNASNGQADDRGGYSPWLDRYFFWNVRETYASLVSLLLREALPPSFTLRKGDNIPLAPGLCGFAAFSFFVFLFYDKSRTARPPSHCTAPSLFILICRSQSPQLAASPLIPILRLSFSPDRLTDELFAPSPQGNSPQIAISRKYPDQSPKIRSHTNSNTNSMINSAINPSYEPFFLYFFIVFAAPTAFPYMTDEPILLYLRCQR